MLWFLARNRKNRPSSGRRGEILFIDARKLGRMVDRTQRELTDADTCHAWCNRTPIPFKGEPHSTPSPSKGERPSTPSPLKGEGRGEGVNAYADIPGFCNSAPLAVRKHDSMLTPGRHVGAEAQEDEANRSRTICNV